MAALSDPRAFLSAQEKRAQQMKAMGIEETDISTTGVVGSDSSSAATKKSKSAPGAKGAAPGAKVEEEKKGTTKFFCKQHLKNHLLLYYMQWSHVRSSTYLLLTYNLTHRKESTEVLLTQNKG